MADYLRMLTLELNGQRYSKREHARGLLKRLDNRTLGAVEFKHGNISAVLLGLGYPYIDGYKPYGNFQSMLLDVVEEQLESNPLVQDAAQAAVLRPATIACIEDGASIRVPAPQPKAAKEKQARSYVPRFSPARRDYLAQEARNRSLGRAGELLVVQLEAQRLHALGKKRLGNRVEHVAATQGDGLGYDVLSFEPNGREILIEVKTTAFGKLTPFYVSRNELARSEADADHYRVYRLFNFRTRPRMFELTGVISSQCELEPTSYLAQVVE